MLGRLFGDKRCKVHGKMLEEGTAPVRYGLIRPRPSYLNAKKLGFPNSWLFVLGGCRVGDRREAKVHYCPDCRAAEARWNEANPDFDQPSSVSVVIQAARRDLPDSLAKRLLKQSQLEKPERAGHRIWIVYRLNLHECVAYNSEHRVYIYPYSSENAAEYSTIEALADLLNDSLSE